MRYADGTRYLAGRARPGQLVPAASAQTWETVIREARRLLR